MQFKHFCLPRDDTPIVLLSCLASFLPFSPCLNSNRSFLPIYPLYSIFMPVPRKKKPPLAVNCPISHVSFLKVEAGREEWGEKLLAQHIGRTVNSLVPLGP